MPGLPREGSGKEPSCKCRRCGFDPLVGKISWRRKWQHTPVFLPGKSYGQNLAGYSPCGLEESDMTECAHIGHAQNSSEWAVGQGKWRSWGQILGAGKCLPPQPWPRTILQVASNSILRVQIAVSRKVPGGWDMAPSFSLGLELFLCSFISP